MVVIVSRPAKAEYYIRSQALYGKGKGTFPARGEHQGTWWNPASLFCDGHQDLASRRIIDPVHFYRLYNGLHPNADRKLTQNAGHPKRTPGYDLTFTADKTVSVLWAIAPNDLRLSITAAHTEAVETALDEVIATHCAFGRTRANPTTVVILHADVLAAVFQHGNTRAGDPHLHTRALVFNVSLASSDKKWRALHSRALFIWQKAAGAVYRAELAWILRTRLGITTQRYGPGQQYIRIPGIPRNLVSQWSSRTNQLADIQSRIGPTTLNAPSKNTLRRNSGINNDRAQSSQDRHVHWTLEALHHVDDLTALIGDLTSHPQTIPHRQLSATRQALSRLPGILKKAGKPLSRPAIHTATSNAAAGHLSRKERHEATLSLLHHPEIQNLLLAHPIATA